MRFPRVSNHRDPHWFEGPYEPTHHGDWLVAAVSILIVVLMIVVELTTT